MIKLDVGLPLYLARQYDQVVEQFRRVLETDPNFIPTHVGLRKYYEHQGILDEAAEECRKIILLSGGKEKAAIDATTSLSG